MASTRMSEHAPVRHVRMSGGPDQAAARSVSGAWRTMTGLRHVNRVLSHALGVVVLVGYQSEHGYVAQAWDYSGAEDPVLIDSTDVIFTHYTEANVELVRLGDSDRYIVHEDLYLENQTSPDPAPDVTYFYQALSFDGTAFTVGPVYEWNGTAAGFTSESLVEIYAIPPVLLDPPIPFWGHVQQVTSLDIAGNEANAATRVWLARDYTIHTHGDPPGGAFAADTASWTTVTIMAEHLTINDDLTITVGATVMGPSFTDIFPRDDPHKASPRHTLRALRGAAGRTLIPWAAETSPSTNVYEVKLVVLDNGSWSYSTLVAWTGTDWDTAPPGLHWGGIFEISGDNVYSGRIRGASGSFGRDPDGRTLVVVGAAGPYYHGADNDRRFVDTTTVDRLIADTPAGWTVLDSAPPGLFYGPPQFSNPQDVSIPLPTVGSLSSLVPVKTAGDESSGQTRFQGFAFTANAGNQDDPYADPDPDFVAAGPIVLTQLDGLHVTSVATGTNPFATHMSLGPVNLGVDTDLGVYLESCGYGASSFDVLIATFLHEDEFQSAVVHYRFGAPLNPTTTVLSETARTRVRTDRFLL